MSKVPAILVYLGPEDGQRMDEIAGLKSLIAKGGGGTVAEVLDEHRFYYPDNSVQDAVALLRNESLFSAHTLVLLFGAEQIRRKDEIDAVESIVSSPPQNGTLVLISEQIKLDRKLEAVVPPASRKIFWELFDNQKRSWLISYFRKRGVSVTPEAVDLLLELVENNTRELRVEAEKLCIYVGVNGTVDVEAVDSFIYHSKEENVFTLFKTVVQDDFEGALETLRALLASGEGSPVQMVAGLVFQVRKLLELRQLLDNRIPQAEAFTKLGIRGKRIQADYSAGAERFSADELKRHLHCLSEFDAAFRQTRPGLHEVLFDLLLYQMLYSAHTLVR